MMNKKTLVITIGILIAVIAIGAFLLSNKKLDSVSFDSENATLCYAYHQENAQGFIDNATAKLIIKGEHVTGEYQNLPAEKDTKTGSFSGTVTSIDADTQARTAKTLWNSSVEGINVTEQLFITFSESHATALLGEMINRGDGTYVYKDQTNLTPGFEMTPVDCKKL